MASRKVYLNELEDAGLLTTAKAVALEADPTETLYGGPQASTISDPSGGATVDAEARTAINAIIDALQAADIVA